MSDNPQLPATCRKCGNTGYLPIPGPDGKIPCPNEFHKREIKQAVKNFADKQIEIDPATNKLIQDNINDLFDTPAEATEGKPCPRCGKPERYGKWHGCTPSVLTDREARGDSAHPSPV